MKRLKRSLSLWLAVILAAGLLYVPVFAGDIETDQQETAVTAAEEVTQEENAADQAEYDEAADTDAEEVPEDEQEEAAASTDDTNKMNEADVDDGGAGIEEDKTEKADTETSAFIEKENSGKDFSVSNEEDESEETISRESYLSAEDGDQSDYAVVTFDANGGYFYNGESVKEENVEKGSKIYTDPYSWSTPSIDDPSKTFAGWSRTQNGPASVDEITVTSNITLYAVWNQRCTVTLHDSKGRFKENTWYENPEAGIIRNAEIYTTVYAKGDYVYKNDFDHLLDLSGTDVLTGWSTEDGGEPFGYSIEVTGDMDLYAVWKSNCTITFDANGGYFDRWGSGDDIYTIDTVRDDYPKGYVLHYITGYNDPEYDEDAGKTFVGWSTTPDGDAFGEEGYTVSGDATLYAVWESLDPIIVTLDANGGCFGGPGYPDTTEPQQFPVYIRNKNDNYVYLTENDIFSRIPGVRSGEMGKSFKGWSTTVDGPVRSDFFVREDITIYAIWGDSAIVAFLANGGYYDYGSYKNEYNMRSYFVGDILERTVLPPDINKRGYYFGGWSLTQDGTPIGPDGIKVNGGETVYAVWCKAGWNKFGSGWKYFILPEDEYDDFDYYNDGWEQIDGKWYFFDQDEWMLTGWIKDDGEWYYLKADGARAENEWAKDSGGWYWMDGSGKITKNKWIQSGGQWYYLKANGYMAANEWAKDSTGWCWMDASGKITKNKWIQSGGQWYYLKANGYMAANEWAKDSGGWYWMDGSGKITRSQWIQTGGKWYYLGANGYMVTGTQKIGGKTYTFSSSGVWIK